MAYQIVVAQSNREELAWELKNALSKALAVMKISPRQVEITDELSDGDISQVLAYLASKEGRDDRKVNAMIEEAIHANVPIIPIARKAEESRIAEMLPESLSHHNTAFWLDEGVSVAMALLRTLGLAESERKVFISYRRSETSALADQMHTAMVQRGFDVFLDRFSLYPGDRFPDRIKENLADKALLLLLESNRLHESEWVQREIEYATHNRIRTLALNLPDCENNVSKIDESYRIRVEDNNLTKQGTMTQEALRRTLDNIELVHASALLKRRLQLLGHVKNKLRSDGYFCQPVEDWSILATGRDGKESQLLWLTPRLPEITDFFGLYHQYARIAGEITQHLKGAVVYDLSDFSDEHQALMDWLAFVTEIGLVQINDL